MQRVDQGIIAKPNNDSFPPPLTSRFPKPDKQDVIANHVSRFINAVQQDYETQHYNK